MKRIEIMINLMVLMLLVVVLSGCVVTSTPDVVVTSNEKQEDIVVTGPVKNSGNDLLFVDRMFEGYSIIEVDGGDQSGHRKPNVAVNVGYGP